MLEYFLTPDLNIFLFLNGLHSSWADVFFYWVSNRFIWLPFYALLAFFLIRKWRKKSIPIFIALVLCIFLTDQSCNLIKHSVQRPRPSHEPGPTAHYTGEDHTVFPLPMPPMPWRWPYLSSFTFRRIASGLSQACCYGCCC